MESNQDAVPVLVSNIQGVKDAERNKQDISNDTGNVSLSKDDNLNLTNGIVDNHSVEVVSKSPVEETVTAVSINEEIVDTPVLMHTDSETSTDTNSTHPSASPQSTDLKLKEVDDSTIITSESSPGETDVLKDPVDGPEQEEATDSNDNPSIYHVKWIVWKSEKTAIITQNENGPCPLLSILNVLLLQRKLALPDGCEVISAEQLLEYLGDLLLNLPSPKVPSPSTASKSNTTTTVLDFQHNMNDAIAVLPKLHTGLDVNVKFTGVSHFEYTPECIIFDLLGIHLYHGWLVDPQHEEQALAVGEKSYNQLVEAVIAANSGQAEGEAPLALVAAQFLEDSASQLTYHGLCELSATLKEDQLVVFFRNNHFSTLYKNRGELFLLVTDQGFLSQESIVWETLGNIEGDTEFVDGSFKSVGVVGERLGGEADAVLAQRLQKEEQQGRDREQMWQKFKDKHLGDTEGLSDAELAARLQAAEERAAQGEAEGAGPGTGQGPSNREQGPNNPIGPRNSKKDKNCSIL